MEPKAQSVKIPEPELEARTDLGIQYNCRQIVSPEHLETCVEKANLPEERGGFFRKPFKEALKGMLVSADTDQSIAGRMQYELESHRLRETLKGQLEAELKPKTVKD